jgi:isoaspartyl peptidase/L-asparaginase-like protein (Ntn-hydrolase superfamily)
MDTPNLVLQGDGATRFARALGFPPGNPATPARIEQAHAIQHQLAVHDPALSPEWQKFDLRAHWNYATPYDVAIRPGEPGDGGDAHDTVGVAVRAADGRFGVALSTGGYSLVLRGRVGDVPILGAGLYAGPAGASAATGTGERVIEEGLAREVHGWLADGVSPKEAAERAVAKLKGKGDIGIIVIGPTDLAAAADRQMAWAGREQGSSTWSGP